MKHVIYISFVVIINFVFTQCAQQTAPTGGVKDKDAPILDTNKAQNTIPRNLSTNFNSKEITFYFNEFIKLNQPQKNIITTPEIKKIDYFLRGKKLILTINEELRPNTTYTINLGEAVQDITEGNYMKNYAYVFSTGEAIDSLTFSGKTIDSYTKVPMKEVTVMLFEANMDYYDTSGTFQKPLYFNKSDASGNFKFNYLKGGMYKVLALLDENNNLKPDPEEQLSFIEQPVVIDTNTSSVVLKLFTPEKQKQFVVEKAIHTNGKITTILNKPTDSISITTIPDNKLINYSKNKDTISVWFDSIQLTSASSVSVLINDFTNSFTDSISLKTPKAFDFKAVRFKTSFNKNQAYFSPITLTVNQPFTSLYSSKFLLSIGEKSQPIKIRDSSTTIFIELENNKQFKQDEMYELQILPGGVEGIYRTNDTIKWAFTTSEDLNYGAINLNLLVPDNNYILELVLNNNTIQKIYFSGSEFSKKFVALPIGSYQIRLITDGNNNKKWDTGNLKNLIQPESVEYYNDPLNVRAGWDLDVSWKIVK